MPELGVVYSGREFEIEITAEAHPGSTTASLGYVPVSGPAEEPDAKTRPGGLPVLIGFESVPPPTSQVRNGLLIVDLPEGHAGTIATVGVAGRSDHTPTPLPEGHSQWHLHVWEAS